MDSSDDAEAAMKVKTDMKAGGLIDIVAIVVVDVNLGCCGGGGGCQKKRGC